MDALLVPRSRSYARWPDGPQLPGGFGSVSRSMPLGFRFGRPGPLLSRVISSRTTSPLNGATATALGRPAVRQRSAPLLLGQTFRHEPFTPLAPPPGGRRQRLRPGEFGSQHPDAGAARGWSGERAVSAQGHGSVGVVQRHRRGRQASPTFGVRALLFGW